MLNIQDVKRGERLKNNLKKNNIEVAELAKIANISKDMIYKMQRGERSLSMDLLSILYKKYNMDIIHIMFGSEKNMYEVNEPQPTYGNNAQNNITLKDVFEENQKQTALMKKILEKL